MIETRQLQYIVTTAELGSFSQAALALRIKQSTLSQRVRQLEYLLGVDLFDRSTKGARLTPAGSEFLTSAQRLIADLDRLKDKTCTYRSGNHGMLSIGIAACVPMSQTQAACLAFSHMHPDVAISAMTADRTRLAQMLGQRQVDLIFVADHLAPEGACYISIGSDRLFAGVHLASPLAAMNHLHWPDLRDADIFMPSGEVGNDLIAQIANRLPGTGQMRSFRRPLLEYPALFQLIGPRACTIFSGALAPDIPNSHVAKPIHERHGHARLDYGLCWLSDNENPPLHNFLQLIEGQRSRCHDDALQMRGPTP